MYTESCNDSNALVECVVTSFNLSVIGLIPVLVFLSLGLCLTMTDQAQDPSVEHALYVQGSQVDLRLIAKLCEHSDWWCGPVNVQGWKAVKGV